MPKTQSVFRKLVILALLISFLAVNSSNASAQTVSFVTDVTSKYQFGQQLEITGQLLDINGSGMVSLILQPEKQASRQISITPQSDLSFQVKYDLTADPLQPFSRIYYWFQAEQADGTVTTSPSFWFDYFDNRYEWKTYSSKLFNIYWTGEDTNLGQVVNDIAKNGLEKATQILPVAPQVPITIYVYPSLKSLQEGLSSSRQEWIAGHASPELGVVLVSTSQDTDTTFDLERQIPHELMHILQYQVIGSDYDNAPAWLLEGLATSSETYPYPERDRALINAVEQGRLLPFSTLCQSFPLQAEQATIAYAQSVSFTDYIQQIYGSTIFENMLSLSKTGLSCDQLVKQSTNLTLNKLTRNWLTTEYPGQKAVRTFPGITILYAFLAVVVVIGLFLLIREIHRKQSHELPS